MNYKKLIIQDDDCSLKMFINVNNKLAIEISDLKYTNEFHIIELDKKDAVALKKELSKLIKQL